MKEHYMPDIEVDSIGENDLPEIARLYEEAFSDHFLGHMGQKFLTLFCAQFMNSPVNYGYVAKCDGRPVGFVLGTIGSEPFHQLYRENFIALSLIVIKRYLRDAYIRKHITKRLGNILVALKTLLPNNKGKSIDQPNTYVPARLLAIGVNSNYRGSGIANKLTSHFCDQMKLQGFMKVGLSALAWNERAISFYKKDGWIQDGGSETSLKFIRILNPASS